MRENGFFDRQGFAWNTSLSEHFTFSMPKASMTLLVTITTLL